MPANKIRRSDDKITDKYKKFAEKLEKFQERLDIPKFYEHGKSVTYQRDDVSYLPTFTTNMITLSQINEEAGKGLPFCHKCKGDGIVGNGNYCDCKRGLILKKKHQDQDNDETFKRLKKHSSETIDAKTARAKQRRIIAQLDDGLDENLPWFDEDDEVIHVIPKHRCRICNEGFYQPSGKKIRGGREIYICDNCGDKDLIQPERKERPFDFGYEPKEEDIREKEILSSIQSMIPDITAKSNKSMNKTAADIVSKLISSLDIDDGKKTWLTAQIESGILNEDIFMRNIKASLRNGGPK